VRASPWPLRRLPSCLLALAQSRLTLWQCRRRPVPAFGSGICSGKSQASRQQGVSAWKVDPPKAILTAMRMILAVLLVALCSPTAWGAEDNARRANWEVYFSPHGGCTEAVVDALGKAKSTVLVEAYSFTSAPIGKALPA
jgi:hypothetical protein